MAEQIHYHAPVPVGAQPGLDADGHGALRVFALELGERFFGERADIERLAVKLVPRYTRQCQQRLDELRHVSHTVMDALHATLEVLCGMSAKGELQQPCLPGNRGER